MRFAVFSVAPLAIVEDSCITSNVMIHHIVHHNGQASSSPAFNRRSSPHVSRGTDPRGLAAIRDPTINLAIWERLPTAGLARAVAEHDFADLEFVRIRTPVDAVEEELRLAFAEGGVARGAASAVLIADAAMLAARFAAVMSVARIELRLEHIVGDACRRFHHDYVRARLIATYSGPGTQWLANDVAARQRAGIEAASRDIHQLETGEVGIFKGADWPGATPITHRSPPIEATGRERLLLVVDTVKAS